MEDIIDYAEPLVKVKLSIPKLEEVLSKGKSEEVSDIILEMIANLRMIKRLAGS